MSTGYHLAELSVVREMSDARRIVPAFACEGWDVLDVGCGIGQTLMAPELSMARERHGIDIDAEAIALGRTLHPELTLSRAVAERIPYPDRRFDLVFSRVALPYTNIPVALREMFRVTRSGGRIWLTLHPWGRERTHLKRAMETVSLKRLIDRSYVLLNGALFTLLGRCVRRPWKREPSYESIQSVGGIRRALRRAGFVDERAEKDTHLVAEARKP